MDQRELYNRTAEYYDIRHGSPTSKEIRKIERRMLDRFCRGKILDLGCGTGHHLSLYDDITGVDISERMLEIASKKARPVVRADARSLPFRDSSFDTVISLLNTMERNVLGEAAGEICRVLKPGGHLAFSTGSVWDNDMGFLEKVREKQPKKEKRFKICKSDVRMDLYTRDELCGIFSSMHPVYFDSAFILQRPKWGDLRHFSIPEKIRLVLERVFPKGYGCVYFMAFRKT